MPGIMLLALGIMVEIITSIHYFKYWGEMSLANHLIDIAILLLFGVALGWGLFIIIRNAISQGLRGRP
ncbi:MAG: hypothetical protein A2Z52_00240 [Candidatus Moranbacteria bacterium RBG_19FT_COMBO_42_6]|nr:MAG: hypothetical protein A2Z52_00240 [Candidatus Moranbacteria bacterium RBG_19FT_COMBO_42_6]